VQHQGNGDELAIAVKSAVAHPIERHIREHCLPLHLGAALPRPALQVVI
jgi:hypothetical protein